jgi:hypothetical protein
MPQALIGLSHIRAGAYTILQVRPVVAALFPLVVELSVADAGQERPPLKWRKQQDGARGIL